MVCIRRNASCPSRHLPQLQNYWVSRNKSTPIVWLLNTPTATETPVSWWSLWERSLWPPRRWGQGAINFGTLLWTLAVYFLLYRPNRAREEGSPLSAHLGRTKQEQFQSSGFQKDRRGCKQGLEWELLYNHNFNGGCTAMILNRTFTTRRYNQNKTRS